MPRATPRISSSRNTKTFVLGLFALAAAIRWAYIANVADVSLVVYPVADARAYHDRALRILAGDWAGGIGNRVFFQDPVYPYFLAFLYSIFGEGSPFVLYVQALLDAGTVLLVVAIARRMMDDRWALCAGLLACLYKVFWFYDALLLKVALTTFLISLALLLLLRADERRTIRARLGAGIALGVACLTRGNYLIFAPLALLWIFLAAEEPLARRGRAGLLFLAGMALAILPVTARNAWVGNDAVLITSQAGHNFYIAHMRENTSGVARMPAFSRFNPAYQELDFQREALRRTGRPMKPSELSRYWVRQGLDEIRADPLQFARHSLRKVGLFFNAYEIPNNLSFDFFRAELAPMLRIPVPTYGAVLPIALLGMFAARKQRPAQLLLLYFWSYVGMVALFYTNSRYRMPVVPVVLAFAALGISELVRTAVARRIGPLALAALFLAPCYLLVHLDLGRENFGISHFNIAVNDVERAEQHRARAEAHASRAEADDAREELRRADALSDRAREQFRRGLEASPTHDGLLQQFRAFLTSRAEELRGRGRNADALDLLQELTRRYPRDVEGHARSAELYLELGRLPEARQALRRTLALDPDLLDAKSVRNRLYGEEPLDP